MGIRLDWEIEAEQTQVRQGGEDPQWKRRRRAAQFRLVLFFLLILALLAAGLGLIVVRLQAVQGEIERDLRGTVESEIAALRLGDNASFTAIQRSASGDWLQSQQMLFNEYQDLKARASLVLTGDILEVVIDRTRARVKVQEILDGVPYTRVCFYWRYDDGWRHVPPDYTFWGAVSTFTGQRVTTRYGEVDRLLGETIGQRVESWLELACATLTCGPIPMLTIEIVPQEGTLPVWSSADPWQIIVNSPYVLRARSDAPFDLDMQFGLAYVLAERLVTQATNGLQPVYPADAYYLRQAIISWLVGQMVQRSTNTFVLDSLAANFGNSAVGSLATILQPTSSVAVLSQISGLPLDQMRLDWRDFLTWRLVAEFDRIQRRDEAGFLGLYDTRDETARTLAYQRFNAPVVGDQPTVVSVQQETGPDGLPLLRAVVETANSLGTNQSEALFRLVDQTWKRLS
ncbi:MAG: hypothetical protein JNM70_18090 [Anaerolineae bacterium]|nr:hypothetical protein [Anaerolineae bacterium]